MPNVGASALNPAAIAGAANPVQYQMSKLRTKPKRELSVTLASILILRVTVIL